jgi:uncharacterized protein YndB with AHSA1/START domain
MAMKLLKIAAILFAVLVIAFLVIGWSLPREYKVEREIVIQAEPALIFSYFECTRSWREWTVWNERDPDMTTTYTGPETGVGSKMAWQSETEGNGALTITEVNPPDGLVYLFEMPEMGTSSTGRINLEAVEDGTRVVWSDEGDLGNNPIFRYFGLVIDDLIGNDFVSGLNNLKILVEAKQKEMAQSGPPVDAVQQLKGALGKALMAQIQENGAVEAIGFCSLEALPLTEQVSKDTGKTLSRITDKPRNAANMADAEGLEILAQMRADLASDQLLTHYQKGAAYYFPLTIQPVCLTCHGQDLTPELKQAIAEKYPEDQATGYALNELRGAIVVK